LSRLSRLCIPVLLLIELRPPAGGVSPVMLSEALTHHALYQELGGVGGVARDPCPPACPVTEAAATSAAATTTAATTAAATTAADTATAAAATTTAGTGAGVSGVPVDSTGTSATAATSGSAVDCSTARWVDGSPAWAYCMSAAYAQWCRWQTTRFHPHGECVSTTPGQPMIGTGCGEFGAQAITPKCHESWLGKRCDARVVLPSPRFCCNEFTLRIQIGNQLEDFSICANPGPRPRYRHRQSFFSRPGYLIAFVLAVCAAIYGSVVLAGPRDVGWVRVRA